MSNQLLSICKENNETKLLIFFISGKKLQKKWKRIRNGYIKEVKKNKQVKFGSTAPAKSSYSYYKRLQFLEPTIKKNSTESNFQTDIDDDENQNSPSENFIQGNNLKTPEQKDNFKISNKKQNKLHSADEHSANILKRCLNQINMDKTEEEDEDKLFCLSLLKELKKVPEAIRLQTKIDIYNLILRKQFVQTQLSYHTTVHSSNHASTSFDQQHTQSISYLYPQYSNYTSTRQDYSTPSTFSNISEIYHESSDIDLF